MSGISPSLSLALHLGFFGTYLDGQDVSTWRAVRVGRRDHRESERQRRRIPAYRAGLDPSGHAQHLAAQLGLASADFVDRQIVLRRVTDGRGNEIAYGEHNEARPDHKTQFRGHRLL